MNHKLIVGGVVSAVLISVLVYAGFVGQLHTITGTLKCPNVKVDTNNADGRMMWTYFSYQLTDSTGRLRQQATTKVNQNPYNYNVDFTPDISGTWWVKTQLLNKRFYKNKVNYFGVCASQSKPISVSKVVNVCGNGVLESDTNTYTSPEQCDDGNTVSEDSCSSTCRIEYCGDGIIQTGLGETCDDFHQSCSSTCQNIAIESQVTNFNNDFVLDELVDNFIIADTEVNRLAPDNNYNQPYEDLVSVYKGRNNYLKRVYYKINLTNITGSVTFDGNVENVVLNLSTDGHSNNPAIGVYLVNSDWDENTLTWNNQPCGTDFSSCTGNSRVVPSQIKVEIPSYEWIWSVRLTTLVNEAITNGDNILRLALKFENEIVVSQFSSDLGIFTNERCPFGNCRTSQKLIVDN